MERCLCYILCQECFRLQVITVAKLSKTLFFSRNKKLECRQLLALVQWLSKSGLHLSNIYELPSAFRLIVPRGPQQLQALNLPVEPRGSGASNCHIYLLSGKQCFPGSPLAEVSILYWPESCHMDTSGCKRC